ncbi:LrgB family protein [Nocardioides sp. JQ2195]|nr:LrgB family protein [Nocardioides sp. JQ2195]
MRSTPLLGVFVTVAAYKVGLEVKRISRNHPLAQPVLVAIIVVGLVMWALDVSYDQYLAGGSIIAFLLGPATVALAVPLHHQAHHLKELALPMLVAIPVGALVSIGGGVLLARALGGGRELELTIAAKSATTPIAISVTEHVGGNASLVAVFTVVAGMMGAVLGPTLLNLLRVRDPRARGLAIGSVSHGIGTSRALHEDPVEGAFSGLSMGLTALATSILVPVVIHLLG